MDIKKIIKQLGLDIRFNYENESDKGKQAPPLSFIAEKLQHSKYASRAERYLGNTLWLNLLRYQFIIEFIEEVEAGKTIDKISSIKKEFKLSSVEEKIFDKLLNIKGEEGLSLDTKKNEEAIKLLVDLKHEYFEKVSNGVLERKAQLEEYLIKKRESTIKTDNSDLIEKNRQLEEENKKLKEMLEKLNAENPTLNSLYNNIHTIKEIWNSKNEIETNPEIPESLKKIQIEKIEKSLKTLEEIIDLKNDNYIQKIENEVLDD